jgi:hypothetical protein
VEEELKMKQVSLFQEYLETGYMSDSLVAGLFLSFFSLARPLT